MHLLTQHSRSSKKSRHRLNNRAEKGSLRLNREGVSMPIASICLVCLSLLLPESGQTATHKVKSRHFAIPIYIQPSKLRDTIDHLVLYSSSDEGKNWRKAAEASPNEGYFVFLAPTAGKYWFTVQTVYNDKTRVPEVIGKTTTPQS